MNTKLYKKVLIHNVDKFPDGYDFAYEELGELDDSELDDLVLLDIDECWYWYAFGSYEGSGEMLIRKGDLYDIHNLGHCSCNSPTEGIEFEGKKISELSVSEEVILEIKDLLDVANNKRGT